MTPEFNMKPTSWFDYLGCDIDCSLLKQLEMLFPIAPKLKLIYRRSEPPTHLAGAFNVLTCLLVLASAFTWGGLSRHHQLS